MASLLGRPRIIHIEDCDVEKPVDRDIPPDPSRVIPVPMQAGDNHNAPQKVSALLFRYDLVHIIHDMRTLKIDRSHPSDYSIIQNFHNKIIVLAENLPPTLRHSNPDMSWDPQHPYLP